MIQPKFALLGLVIPLLGLTTWLHQPGPVYDYPGDPAELVALRRGPSLHATTETSTTIIWTTDVSATSEVRYSTDLSYAYVAPATTRYIPALDVYEHHARLTSLTSDTAYHYKVYSDGVDLIPGQDLTFRTAPPASGLSFTFIAFGDSRAPGYGRDAVRNRLLAETFDVAIHTGDIARYGTYAEFESDYFAVYADLIRHIPFFPITGNHDYDTVDAAPFRDLFVLPENAWRPADRERYYSFDWGNAHFVALDTETPLGQISDAATDDMADWLAADLAATDRFWKFIFLHKPPYSAGPHGSSTTVQTRLVPIFEAYGVNVVFAGHDHDYERTHPIRAGALSTVADGGIVYYVTGGGGAPLYSVGSGWWTAFARSAYHYIRAELTSCRLVLRAIDPSGVEFDTYVVDKLPAELTGDGRVGEDDVRVAALKWRGPYDVRFDLRADGRLDVVDVQLVANDWGKHCLPQPRKQVSARNTVPDSIAKLRR